MKENTKAGIVLIFVSLVLLFGLFLIYDSKKEDNNWWTKVFCAKEKGYFVESKYLSDSCITNNGECRAKFIYPNREQCRAESNFTISNCDKRWTLVCEDEVQGESE